tara:strand:- start:137 stop:556 length:420 start_codon:yes stop_codon:yes gene_type:complete
MNTHRAVRQYLAKAENKTELKSEKVELGAAEDVQKSISTINAAIKEAKATLKEFQAAKAEFAKAEAKALKVRKTAKAKSAKAYKIESNVSKLSDKIEKQAKDFGISTSAIKGYGTMESLQADLFDIADEIENFDFDLGQ